MNNKDIKTITEPIALRSCDIGEIVNMNLPQYKGLVKIEAYNPNTNNCSNCVFSIGAKCNLKCDCYSVVAHKEIVFNAVKN